MASRLPHLPGPSSPNLDWKVVWDSNVPPKVKVFIWKLSQHTLPAGHNLVKRRINTHGLCLRCHNTMETDHHLFLERLFAQRLWRLMGFPISSWTMVASSWLHLFSIIASDHRDGKDNVCQFMMCLWYIWKTRNSLIFYGKQGNEKMVADNVLSFLHNYKDIGVVGVPGNQIEHEHPSRWLPPDERWLMLNTDAYCVNNISGFGFVLRDRFGHVLKSGAGPILHATSTEHAGTMAMWEGLHRISKFWHLRLASKINSQEINLSALGGIIMDLKDLLFSIRFSRVIFLF